MIHGVPVMVRKLVLVDYNPDWPHLFNKEVKQLSKVFGEILVNIHHIGSTSIPMTCAKPVIDILVEVTNIESVDSRNPMLVELGYVPRGEAGIEGRRFFRKGGDERTHHIHAHQVESPHIERHLNFRDYLRAHPEVAREYCQLKKKLTKMYLDDIERYTEGKTEFITDIEQRAREWKEQSMK